MKNVVLVADRISDFSGTITQSKNLEFVEDKYFNPLFAALGEIAPLVYHYDSPEMLLEHIKEHSNDIVLTVWSGQNSRNRKAIIQSICEGYNIPYVGADAYLQIIAADKHLSKILCKPFEIYGAEDVLISKPSDFWLIKSLKFPVIIKPNLEGGSIGIFQKNVVPNYEMAITVCNELLPHFSPLIVEEYLPGEEINVCIAGVHGNIDVFEAVRQSVDGKTFFTSEIVGAESKKIDKSRRTKEIVTETFPTEERIKLIALFHSLGKAEVIRIDGRLSNNTFRLLELTPDCSLSSTGSVGKAFQATGYKYPEMLRLLLNNAVKAWEGQNASM